MKTVFRLAAWLCVAIIVALSLLPSDSMARTGADSRLEHAMAYAGTAFFVGLGYLEEEHWATLAGLMAALAGTMELLQHFSPGRHPAFADFAASSLGALIGLAVAWRATKMCSFKRLQSVIRLKPDV